MANAFDTSGGIRLEALTFDVKEGNIDALHDGVPASVGGGV